jgi:hypothetical protein
MALRPRYAVFAIIIGAALTVVGGFIITEIGELSDRTQQAVAVVEGDTARFVTIDGADVVILMGDRCKRRVPAPGRGCAVPFKVGDEFLLRYDEADPRHVWSGATPGGGRATGMLYAGISLITVGLVTLLVLLKVPRLVRRRPPAA